MNHRYALLVAAISFRSIFLMAQQPTMAWEAFFNGTLPGADEARALVVAPDNSVYVTGGATNLAPQGTITTIRYSPAGAQLWADHVYGPAQETQNKGTDIALDPWGHVYVCGNFSASGGDLGLIKYGSNGRIWRENYEQYPMADVQDEATGLAVDAAGEVHVAGWITSTAGMGLESYLLKTDSAGTELWHNAFSPSSADETATDVAVSAAGGVFVGGDWWDLDGGGINLSVARFSSAGTTTWTESIEAAGMSDRVARITTTTSGNVIAAGSATIGTTPDAVIAAWDGDGNALWNVVHAGTGNADDDAVDVKELSDGRVAAVLHSRETLSGSLRHAITTMLIENGTVIWSRQFTGASGLGAWPTSMAVGPGDRIHIAGYTIVSGGATTDGLLLTYDAAGDELWSIPYDGGADGDDRFIAIDVNGFGDVVVCGTSHTNPSESRYVTVQFGNAVGVPEATMALPGLDPWPNPAQDRIMLDGIGANDWVEVHDAIGQCVHRARGNAVDVSRWSEGVYLVKAAGLTARLIVSK